MDPIDRLDAPATVARIAAIVRAVGRWREAEERAAATLAITITTTPFDERETLLATLLIIAGVPSSRWGERLTAPGRDIVAAEPREALLQLVDRERTYLSNVPVHTALARVCRALVRRGLLGRLEGIRTVDDLNRSMDGGPDRLDSLEKATV